jgi:hypothetical protein
MDDVLREAERFLPLLAESLQKEDEELNTLKLDIEARIGCIKQKQQAVKLLLGQATSLGREAPKRSGRYRRGEGHTGRRNDTDIGPTVKRILAQHPDWTPAEVLRHMESEGYEFFQQKSITSVAKAVSRARHAQVRTTVEDRADLHQAPRGGYA